MGLQSDPIDPTKTRLYSFPPMVLGVTDIALNGNNLLMGEKIRNECSLTGHLQFPTMDSSFVLSLT